MGFNSVAVIYNDFVGELKQDGHYGGRIATAIIQSFGERGLAAHRAGYFGAGIIVSQAHADALQVCVIGRNTGCNLGDDNAPPEAVEAAISVLRRKGYKITKPKAPAPAMEAPAGAETGTGSVGDDSAVVGDEAPLSNPRNDAADQRRE